MSAGSVKRRGESWRGRFRNGEGKDVQRTFARKADADRWVREQLAAVETGTYVDPHAGRVTFSEYAAAWLGTQHTRERTQTLQESRVRLYLNPVIGALLLRQIRRSHLVEIVRRCSVDLGLSPLVTKYALATGRAILDSAMRDRLIAVNPAADPTIALPRRERATGTLSAEQVRQIAERMTPRLRAAVVLGAATGLRPGELFGLTIDRVIGVSALITDGTVVEISARHAASRPGGARPGAALVVRVDRQLNERREFAPVKSASSNRDVSIPPSVVAVLVEHVHEHGTGDDGLLFTTPTGKSMHSAARSGAWARATDGLVLPEGSWHLLRHHHASSLLSEGLNPAMVARRLGHANAAITMTTYAHCLPNDDERALAISEQIAARLA